MTSATPAPPSRDRRLVAALCALGAAHVLCFSAAFPFFNIVDEQYHLDMVVKLSQGHLPRGLEPLHEEAVAYIVFFGTPEYFWPRSAFTNGVPPPPWTVPLEEIASHLLATERHWKSIPNVEASQPPLYYVIAGTWWRLASAIGLSDGPLLYSVRFLNALLVALLVWLGHLAARLGLPENRFVQLGLPATLALLPQPAFYSIGNDTLPALAFGAVFIGVTRILQAERPGVGLATGAGLAFAAAYLAKLTTIPFLAVTLLALAGKLWQLHRARALRASLPAVLAFTACAALPILAWMAWTRVHFGDFTGSTDKIRLLDWTLKPWAERWSHPLFTPGGLWVFLTGLLGTLWQGEFLWYGERLTSPLADRFYALVSLGLLALVAGRLLARRSPVPAPERQALGYALACVAAGLLFLGYLSICFDFGQCFHPSREHPYFTSGRLLTGALIPFLLLWLRGLDWALAPLQQPRLRWVVLAGWLALMLVLETAANRPVFGNPYNWFHL